VIWHSSINDFGSGLRQLPNGNLLYLQDGMAIEQDMLGTIVSRVVLDDPGQGLHHDLAPTDHGTLLSLTTEVLLADDLPTSDIDPNAPRRTAEIRDLPAVEFDANGAVVNYWPLRDLVDPSRPCFFSLCRRDPLNWAHSNAILHDSTDDSIIVSLRYQSAVIKFSRTTGELRWILGSPANWAPRFEPFLLQATGLPFEWQYAQHAPKVTPDGTLLLFDNGNFRANPFDGQTPLLASGTYSPAVEFKINESSMEVEQVWEYGSQLSERLFLRAVSDADWLPETDNILITFGLTSHVAGVPGSELGLGATHVRIMEVTHTSPATRVFDIRVTNTDSSDRLGVYRSSRIPSLYPPAVKRN